MPSPRSHLFAAAVLALGGGLLGVTTLAIVVARAVLAAGVPGVVVKPQDAALLDDLFAVLPFIVTFAALNLAAAVGLALGRRWGVTVGSWVASVAVAIGLLGLLLLVAGSAPSPVAGTGRAGDPDGLAIISVAVCLYASAAVALRLPDGRAPAFHPVSAAA